MRTLELTGPALDWAVAVAAGRKPTLHKSWPQTPGYVTVENDGAQLDWNPTHDWRIAGPIIEREAIGVKQPDCPPAALVPGREWVALKWDPYPDRVFVGRGGTPLISAMRCCVASKLGEAIDLPEELQ